jgi:hypothetical protein
MALLPSNWIILTPHYDDSQEQRRNETCQLLTVCTTLSASDAGNCMSITIPTGCLQSPPRPWTFIDPHSTGGFRLLYAHGQGTPKRTRSKSTASSTSGIPHKGFRCSSVQEWKHKRSSIKARVRPCLNDPRRIARGAERLRRQYGCYPRCTHMDNVSLILGIRYWKDRS